MPRVFSALSVFLVVTSVIPGAGSPVQIRENRTLL